MNRLLHICIALAVVSLVGCSQKPVVIDPTVVSSNYDYVKPVDVAEQSKPVWILPLINTGWVPAFIDPKTGDWVGGHYQATVVQPGYWATLEEAELAGRPYIVAGEGKPVIPVPPSEVGPSSGVNPELDIVGLQKKVEALENKTNQPPLAAGDQDQLATLAAQVSALAAQTSVSSSIASDVPAYQNTQGYRPEVMVNAIPNSAMGQMNMAAPQQQAYQNSIYSNDLPQQISGVNENTLILPPKPPGTAFDLNPDSGSQKISVRYLENSQVQINYNGKTYNVRLRNPNDKIRVTVPKH